MARWTGFTVNVKCGRLVAEGVVTPSPLAARYSIRLEYKLGKPPKIWVLDPELHDRSEDERIPHVYHEKGMPPRPCLYLPWGDEWRPHRLLSDTMLPWLLVWLEYYEFWHITGSWGGGGVETGPSGGSAPELKQRPASPADSTTTSGRSRQGLPTRAFATGAP